MPTKQFQKIDVSFATFFRFFAVLLLIVAAYYLLNVIASLLFAVVIVSGIEPLVQRLIRFRLSRIAAVVVVYLFFAFVLVGLVYLVLPAIGGEFQNFISAYPVYQREILREIQSFSGLPFYNLFSDNRAEILATAPDQITRFAENTFRFAINIFGGVIAAIITVVISFYLATQENGIENFLRLVSPLEYEEYAIDLWGRARRKVGLWLRAQLLLGVIVGVLVYISLTLLGIRYSLMFALLAALLEIIPVIGPILAAAPAVVVAFVQSPLLGLVVVVVYVVIQQIESHLIVPTVMRRAIGLNPLVVVISLLVGGTLAGVMGLLLAVPAASIIVEILTDTDRKKRGVFQYTAPTEG